MAIKIDLLPAYVGLTKVFRRVVTLSLLSLGLLLTGLVLVYHSKQLELQTAQQNLQVAQGLANQTAAADTATQTANAARAGYDAANNFMLASSKTGAERSALLNLIRQYIYENSVVRSIDITDGRTVTIVATVTTPDEYAQFLARLRRATGVVFAANPLPRVSGVGGFANGATPLVVPQPDPGSAPVVVNYPITLTAQATLLNPIQLPVDPVGGGATANGAPGAPGFPGPPGGFPGGPPGGPAGIPPGGPPRASTP